MAAVGHGRIAAYPALWARTSVFVANHHHATHVVVTNAPGDPLGHIKPRDGRISSKRHLNNQQLI